MRVILGLFAASQAVDVVRVPVSTQQAPTGYADRATDDASREQMSQLAGYVPVFVETQLNPGDDGWQAGEDLLVMSPDSLLESTDVQKQHGFIFLHGAGQSADEASNLDFVTQLLEHMPGVAALPQALPKFQNTIWYPKTEDEPVQPGKNALVVPSYPAWTSFYRPSPFPCFADQTDDRNAFWTDVEAENRGRVKAYVAQLLARGIPPENIYILGFSIGAVAAQRVLVDLAQDGYRLGGGVGFDGADVDQIANQEAFAAHPQLPVLYFMYSTPPAVADSQAGCLESYGLDLQLNRVQTDAEVVPHAVYPELLNTTLLWLQAKNKRAAAGDVEAAWRRALAEMHHVVV